MMAKQRAGRILGVGLFLLSLTVSGLSFATVASAGEAACPSCDTVELNCKGSTCECKWGFAGYKCVP
jgi:hypothetical protein